MKKALVTLVILGALGVFGWKLLGKSGASKDAVPTYTVTKSAFVRRVTAEGNLRAVKATPVAAPSQGGGFGPMKIAWLAPDGKPVKAGEVVVRFDPSQPEKELKTGQADLAAAEAKLAGEQIKSRTAVAGRDSAADLAAAELDQQRKFQSKDEEIFSHNTIVESAIDEKLATAKQAHAEQTKAIERKLAQSKAGVIAVEKQKAQIAIAHAKTALEGMEIKAPHDGILVLRRNWRGELPRVGEQLWPGQKVAEIPLLDTMEAEVFVLEVDGSGLANDQKAEVVVEAKPDITYEGKVKLVDKLAKPRQPGVPVQYFAVVLALAKTDHDVMKPGQRVRATLILDAADALVVPRQAIVAKEGKSFVYKKGKLGFEPAEVELGPGTSGRVVVTKGLAANDVIALRDPTRSVDQATGSGSASVSDKAAKP
ncbi:MAG: HlyD family efflux transporter periplasmic adaptor subunit [Kofleriaceae bacterium]|nr:HlyD family efflux transporter periplasmic adaptor subunit [Kofleriaceae bacterium]